MTDPSPRSSQLCGVAHPGYEHHCTFPAGHGSVEVIDPGEKDPERGIFMEHGDPERGAWWNVITTVDDPDDLSSWTQYPHRLAVDAKGYVWRVYDDGVWSMAPTNADNSEIPLPITLYEPIKPTRWERIRRAVLDAAKETKAAGDSDQTGPS